MLTVGLIMIGDLLMLWGSVCSTCSSFWNLDSFRLLLFRLYQDISGLS